MPQVHFYDEASAIISHPKLDVKRCLAHDELESKRLDAETTKELEQQMPTILLPYKPRRCGQSDKRNSIWQHTNVPLQYLATTNDVIQGGFYISDGH